MKVGYIRVSTKDQNTERQEVVKKVITNDGKMYDLDCMISRRQSKLLECLSAIDALFADLSAEGMKLEDSINQTEVKLNQKKRH